MALRFHPDKAMAGSRVSRDVGGHGTPLGGAAALEARLREAANQIFGCVRVAAMVWGTVLDMLRRRLILWCVMGLRVPVVICSKGGHVALSCFC